MRRASAVEFDTRVVREADSNGKATAKNRRWTRLIEWFKVNHPTLASEAEREIRARIKEKREWEREQADDIEPPF